MHKIHCNSFRQFCKELLSFDCRFYSVVHVISAACKLHTLKGLSYLCSIDFVDLALLRQRYSILFGSRMHQLSAATSCHIPLGFSGVSFEIQLQLQKLAQKNQMFFFRILSLVGFNSILRLILAYEQYYCAEIKTSQPSLMNLKLCFVSYESIFFVLLGTFYYSFSFYLGISKIKFNLKLSDLFCRKNPYFLN